MSRNISGSASSPAGPPATVSRGSSAAMHLASSSPGLRSVIDRSGSPIRWVPVSVCPAVASWSALPVSFSQASTSARSNVGLVGLPPTGFGNSGYLRRQFDTAARPTPASRPIAAAVISSRSPVSTRRLYSMIRSRSKLL